ncbi:forkhead box protein D1-like [Brachypodium distachyon]|uniref:forkhead box protein D1-like n=1 Tax=Brachypodium distachyon TaxID=15368 RepID=UPI00052FEB05|nr:forkhead box protein D1-like [Brachypodium distachyon]|eukprot:XP_010239367.1 forkhead box protein D1-like [Brachypodium distachyon]
MAVARQARNGPAAPRTPPLANPSDLTGSGTTNPGSGASITGSGHASHGSGIRHDPAATHAAAHQQRVPQQLGNRAVTAATRPIQTRPRPPPSRAAEPPPSSRFAAPKLDPVTPSTDPAMPRPDLASPAKEPALLLPKIPAQDPSPRKRAPRNESPAATVCRTGFARRQPPAAVREDTLGGGLGAAAMEAPPVSPAGATRGQER